MILPKYFTELFYLSPSSLKPAYFRFNFSRGYKVSQLKTLTQESWIAIDRSKRGPSNHKAFLTKEGKKIIQNRQKDFQFILLLQAKNIQLKGI